MWSVFKWNNEMRKRTSSIENANYKKGIRKSDILLGKTHSSRWEFIVGTPTMVGVWNFLINAGKEG